MRQPPTVRKQLLGACSCVFIFEYATSPYPSGEPLAARKSVVEGASEKSVFFREYQPKTCLGVSPKEARELERRSSFNR
ncbi:hypothetical protein [Bacillus cereus]